MAVSIHKPNKFKTRPVAVLLDLDNTLYPYERNHLYALKQVKEKAGKLLSLAPREFDTLYDAARSETKARLGRTSASHSRLLYFQRLIELAGFKTQVLIALDLEQTYWRSFLAEARLFDDVFEFLDDLRQLGVPSAVVTDLTSQIQYRKIVHFGLDRYVDYVVTSEEVGADKPSRAMFDTALKKIGDVTGPIWMIGDDPVADIAGAAVLENAVTIQMIQAGVERQVVSADAQIVSFSDLRSLLAGINESDT